MPEGKEKVKLYVTIGLLAFLLSFAGTIGANAFYGGRYAEKVDINEKRINKIEQSFDTHREYDNNEYVRKSQFYEYKESRSDFQQRVLSELQWIKNRLK